MPDEDDARPIWQRMLDSVRGDREMHGWERILFYLVVLYCGSEFVFEQLVPTARAIGGAG